MKLSVLDHAVGVDGCRSGWIAVRLDAGGLLVSLSVHESFAHLLAAHAGARSIAVDIPIGLSECFTPRRCDLDARVLLGPRRSSVFPAPDRRLLRFPVYAEANRFSREQCGKGISQQCFHIFGKIAEVDSLLSPEMQARVFETHPELCFQGALGGTCCHHSKCTREGYEERRRILARVLPGVPVPERSRIAKGLRGVQPDDILDAMIAAWTARRHCRGESRQIPFVPELDPRGLRMEITF